MLQEVALSLHSCPPECLTPFSATSRTPVASQDSDRQGATCPLSGGFWVMNTFIRWLEPVLSSFPLQQSFRDNTLAFVPLVKLDPEPFLPSCHLLTFYFLSKILDQIFEESLMKFRPSTHCHCLS